jgi:hypothetical protein
MKTNDASTLIFDDMNNWTRLALLELVVSKRTNPNLDIEQASRILRVQTDTVKMMLAAHRDSLLADMPTLA